MYQRTASRFSKLTWCPGTTELRLRFPCIEIHLSHELRRTLPRTRQTSKNPIFFEKVRGRGVAAATARNFLFKSKSQSANLQYYAKKNGAWLMVLDQRERSKNFDRSGDLIQPHLSLWFQQFARPLTGGD